MMRATYLPALIGLGSLFAITAATEAATATWTGATNGTWSTASNWSTPPAVTGDDLVFDGSSNLSNTNDYVTAVTGISFAAGAGGFTLGGNALTLPNGAAISNSSSAAQALTLGVTTASGSTVSIQASTSPLTFSGRFSTPDGNNATRFLSIGGPSAVTLSGGTSNVFGLGATITSGATLVLANSVGNAILNTVTINDGGTLRLNGATTDQIHFNQTVTLGGSSAVFDLNGKNEEIGKLEGTAGTVTNGSATSATLTVGGGTNSSDFSSILLANGTGVLAVTTRNVAAATYTLGAANTFTGKMTIGGTTNVSALANGGVASSIGAGTSASGSLQIANPGTLRYTGATSSTDRAFTTSNATGSVIEVVNSAANLSLTGTSFGAFTKTGSGTLTLDTATSNAFPSGTLTVAAGTVAIGPNSAGNVFHDNTSVALNAGGSFDMGGKNEKFNSISGTGTFLNTGGSQSTLTVSGFSGSSVFGGQITGNIALTHSDANSSTTLNGLNTYSGNTSITNATATFTLGTTGGLTFYPSANGGTNWINGTAGATVNLDGGFTFDLTNADVTDGNIWNIVEASDLVETYGASFAVSGFTQASDVWTRVDGSNTWTFTESTGVLSLSVVPEPLTSSLIVAAVLCGGAMATRRRRN